MVRNWKTYESCWLGIGLTTLAQESVLRQRVSFSAGGTVLRKLVLGCGFWTHRLHALRIPFFLSPPLFFWEGGGFTFM